MTDFLEVKHKEIASRLKELKPLVDEFNRLEAAASALAGVIGSAASEATSAAAATVTRRRRRGRGRPRGSKTTTASVSTPASSKPSPTTKPTAKRKRGRRKGSGGRAAQALKLIRAEPGITIPELAAKMGIKENYLYRVLPGLEQEGKIRKEGRGWYPKET